MKNRSVKKCLTAVVLLATGLSATQASANWYMDQSKDYYKTPQYQDNKYGNFPPLDIEEKLFRHLNTDAEAEESKTPTANAPATTYNNQPATTDIPQTSNPAQNYQQPAYGNYYQGRNYAPGSQRRYNRNTNFSGPWNNNGSSSSMPWGNNNRSGSGFNPMGNAGPWNNNNSNFSGPWDNNGSSFSMPWGNNNRSGSGFNPMGNGGGFSW